MSSTARANPSSVFEGVTCLAWCFTSGLALPIAMLTRLPLNICTSLGMSPMVAIWSRGMDSRWERYFTTMPLLASG